MDKITDEYYIGVRSCKCLPEEDTYMGSMKTWEPNKINLYKIITGLYTTRLEANASETKQIYLALKVLKDKKCKNAHIPNIGFHVLGIPCSEEHKLKISAANKGRRLAPITEEHRQKLRERQTGKIMTDTTKTKISEKLKGRVISDEHKELLRQLSIGREPWIKGKKMGCKSNEIKKKISEHRKGKPAWNKGKKTSAETKHKISESKKGQIPWNKGKKLKKLNIAIFGGAFNPPTLAHFSVAKLVLDNTKYDEVWFMPCFGHMDGKELVAPEHRIAMLQGLAQLDGRVKVSDYEIKHQLHGETYHLLNKLIHDPAYEHCRFGFIIGQDRANTISSWYNAEELLKLDVSFIVIPRHGVERTPAADWCLQSPHIYIQPEKQTNHIFQKDASSSLVRSYLREGDHAVSHYIDGTTLKYILEHKLYQ